MRRVLLAGLLLLALALGVGGGYYAGDRYDTPEPSAIGTAGPLGVLSTSPSPTPTEPSLPVKTPVPNNLDPLETGLHYTRHTFTVTPKDEPSVDLSIETPQGWRLTRDDKYPAEVKYLDDQKVRGVRVQAVEPVVQTPADAMALLILNLKSSQAPQNDLQIRSKTTGKVAGDDGQSRPVATLIYTYIPGDTLRYVIVRWVATQGQLNDVTMSITGLPQDANGLNEVLQKATTTVHEVG
ncbi:hypothetical protein [Kribbella kalugense]|uniref:Uncharacterized protein n=1 Tax=Kribbella kalugense TaxID=2512221 RepID=A0A4R7ZKC2_9ACTN|nr:hypothetical protein [Kribbella kalugense]TDW17636.1 hypothetical protein EV650_4211 [Kribbella kalugense]